ncbi:MAG: alpha/beta fold hydrolase [Planctomycetota bacterium]
MPDLGHLPRALRERTVFARLTDDASVPALLAHPDEEWHNGGTTPRPVVLWMHGRTVSKELDPGRYLRWMRAGIATCAIDLPGHGERLDRARHSSDMTLGVIEECVPEIERVVEHLRSGFGGAFDTDRIGIGGMSAGGMVTLARLCEPHAFVSAAVESTAGDFSVMKGHPFFEPGAVERLNPIRRLDGWRDIPLLALHSESDEWVPVDGIRNFTDALGRAGKDAAGVELVTWPETGAPAEHAGFGRVANEAKNIQTDFFVRTLQRDAG